MEELKEKPLEYWEEESYMLVVPEEATLDLLDSIIDRVSNMEKIKVINSQDLTDSEPGKIKLIYEEEEYEVKFYPSSFSVPEYYLNKSYYFKEEEKEKLRNANAALTIFMKFNKDAKKSYHLELKLALAMIPNLIGILDESAEKMLPAAWVRMTANSKVLPGANDLFNVQAVTGDNGEVWLHTHGLCRCGLTELEILKSNKDNYQNHYYLISTLASYLIDKNEDFNGVAYIGVLSNQQPVVATYLSWTEGIKEYSDLDLGGVLDRQDGHNTKTSVIFLYKNEEDEKNKKLTKVSEFDELWKDNPIFFISNEETARMKELAMERFHFVKEEGVKEGNKAIIKIGLSVDEETKEHIWFELLEIEGDKFKAKLTQEPYKVENMHEGDIGWYTVLDVTDWVIYTPEFSVTPGTAYLLVK